MARNGAQINEAEESVNDILVSLSVLPSQGVFEVDSALESGRDHQYTTSPNRAFGDLA